MSFFTKEDFNLIEDSAGQPYDKNNTTDPTFSKLQLVNSTLIKIAQAMEEEPYGFSYIKSHTPLDGTNKKYREYLWVRLYPNYAKDARDKVHVGLHINKAGFNIVIDRRITGKSYEEHIKPIEDNDSTVKDNAEIIHKRSIEHLDVDKICSLSEDEIVAKVKDYWDTHQDMYLEMGKLYRIKSCINKLEEKKKKMEIQKYVELLRRNKNLILTGAPGTGKTYLAKEIAKAMGANEDNGRFGFVQFHPSYDYTDFVEGLRPVKKGDTIGFERRDGIFMDFCRKALKDPKNDYVFIIDEINRGEISKILGELFFAIDPGYRGKEGMVSTQYSNLWKDSKKVEPNSEKAEPTREDEDMKTQKFYIPENVYIIGTMNDIDRSVESMDFAMRRRFAFKEVTAESSQGMIDSCKELEDVETKYKEEIKRRMDSLNRKIKEVPGLGSAYEVGAAYFLKLQNYLGNDKQPTKDSWDALWEYHLKGLLFEYLRGMPDQENHLNALKDAYDQGVNEKSSDSSIQSNS